MTQTTQNATQQLIQAVLANNPERITAALADGANLEAKDSDGRTPLLLAVRGNHIQAAQSLINAGANVNAQDHMQDSPFLYAGAAGQTMIVLMCMRAGADYKVYNRYGGSALIPACERGHVATVKALLTDKNFPVDHINRLGWTGLLEAVILSDGGPNHVEIARLLLAAGANVNLADKDGVTPLAHARQKKQKEMAALLEKAGGK